MEIRFQNILILFFVFINSFIFLSACRNKRGSIENAQKKELWTCSMHPEIIRDKPGTCPICGMDLVKKVENATALNEIMVNDLLQPTDRFVVSSIPVTTMNRTTMSVETDALGIIAYDSRFANTISARVSGRIEKLYIKYRYQNIMKGQRVMDIYSPELLTAQQNLLFLLKNDAGNISFINAAKEKLLLLGMSEKELNKVIQTGRPLYSIGVYSAYTGHIHDAGMRANPAAGEMDPSESLTQELSLKEGMYVQKGQSLFMIMNHHNVWALLQIFENDRSLVKKGDAVRIIPETDTAAVINGNIDFIEPFFQKGSKTLSARVYFHNEKMLPIGSHVRASVFSNTKESDWLPADAVLSLGMDKVVFIKTMGGFKAHEVETGISYKNQIQILSGLNATDSVAANAQFLTDSESFIKVNDQ